MQQNRIDWIDTIKTFGMFFIVLGHFFPPYISAWIYTFNVPLFFFVSGYLAKKEDNWKIFWRKTFYGLMVPFIILSILINFRYIVHSIYDMDMDRITYMIIGILSGFHSIDGMYGCMNMWFVYCLLLVRILFQCSKDGRYRLILVFGCIVGMIFYHLNDVKLKWAFSNVLYAFPYYTLGYWFKSNNLIRFANIIVNKWEWNLMIYSLMSLTIYISSLNGIAYTYEGGGR